MLQHVATSFEAVAQRIAGGDHERAARQFVDEVALGPGAWDNQLPPEVQATFIENASAFLDELNDPEALEIDKAALGRLQVPVVLTNGTESPPLFPRVIDRLVRLIPHATRQTLDGAGHEPHQTMPKRYADITRHQITRTAD
jgi:pimeloyl-ACP methyl ester carboxylesterase